MSTAPPDPLPTDYPPGPAPGFSVGLRHSVTIYEPSALVVATVSGTGYSMCIGGRELPPPPPAMTTSSPLLFVGTFGVHVIGNARGYSFVGEVPVGIKVGGYKSLEEGIAAFVAWFKAQDVDFQREHVGNLRNDVFALVLAG